MHSGNDQVSPVSPLSPLSPCPASQRFRTILPTAHNFCPPKYRPPPTVSSHREPNHPTFSQSSYPHTLSQAQSSWQENPTYTAQNTGHLASLSSTDYLDSWPPQTSIIASSSLPLRITTSLSASLSIRLWRKQSRKKSCRRFKGGGSSTDLPPDSGSNFLNHPRYWHPQYYHASTSAPALPSQSWTSDEEEDDEEKDVVPARKLASHFLLKHLSGYPRERAFYGEVTSGQLIPKPQSHFSDTMSLCVSPNDFLPRCSGNKKSFRLLLILFREHNTIVRIVKWLRREDVLNLVLVSKRIREGVLRSSLGLGLEDSERSDEIGNEGKDTAVKGEIYQLSPLSPISPLNLNLSNMDPPVDSQSPATWGRGGSHIGLLKSVEKPADQSRDLARISLRVEDYPEMLGRLVWLLTLAASCKSAHPVLQQRVKLKFCVWCGGCICGECDISSYIAHSHRLRRLCFDCWRLCGNQKSNHWEPVTLGSSTNLCIPGESLRKAEAAKARALLCTCRVGDEWICPDCHSGGNFLELAGAETRYECWVCGKAPGGIASRWNLPTPGGMGLHGDDVWSLCLWCGKRMRVKAEDYSHEPGHGLRSRAQS